MSNPESRDTKLQLGGPNVSMGELFSLQYRTIAITGGGGAMGLNIASAVLEQGGDVICFDRMEKPLQDLWDKAQSIAAKHGGRIWYYMLDISNTTSIDSTFGLAFQKMRWALHGFVACAGISDGGPSADFPLDRARKLLGVNVTGTFACVQAVAKHVRAVRDTDLKRTQLSELLGKTSRGEVDRNISASIVIIASMSGHGSNKGVDTALYNASKAALHQLTRSLAAEWGSNPDFPLIRVNSISPGYIITRMTEETLSKPGMKELWEGENMLNRLSEADEYRGPAIFLLSDASSFVTGSDLRVDGGHTQW